MKDALKKADELHEFEIEKYLEVIEALHAENARFRSALERIENECSRHDTTAWSIASDALEEV